MYVVAKDVFANSSGTSPAATVDGKQGINRVEYPSRLALPDLCLVLLCTYL